MKPAGLRPGVRFLAAAALVGSIGAAAFWLACEDAALARGRALYDAHCASCHGGDLAGQADWQSAGPDGLLPAPPHDASGHTWHHSDADLIAYITLGGHEALARMGVTFDSGMPGFGAVLTAQEIVEILDYIKSSWPERERLFQAEQSASGGG